MAVLATVADFVSQARVLLQDTVSPYRYSDPELVQSLNFGLLEARRLRADLFLGRYTALPNYPTNDSTPVVIDDQYRVAFLYYMVGNAQLRDEEDTQDSRASAFLNKFLSQMLTIQA